eukprot:4115271-Amphidinium_carterae.3
MSNHLYWYIRYFEAYCPGSISHSVLCFVRIELAFGPLFSVILRSTLKHVCARCQRCLSLTEALLKTHKTALIEKDLYCMVPRPSNDDLSNPRGGSRQSLRGFAEIGCKVRGVRKPKQSEGCARGNQKGHDRRRMQVGASMREQRT